MDGLAGALGRGRAPHTWAPPAAEGFWPAQGMGLAVHAVPDGQRLCLQVAGTTMPSPFLGIGARTRQPGGRWSLGAQRGSAPCRPPSVCPARLSRCLRMGCCPPCSQEPPLQPRLAPPAATSRPGVPEVDSWVLRCMPALPAIWEAEAGGSQTGGQPGQRGEPVSKCKRGREREGETEAERRETRPSGGRRAAFNHRVQILGGTRAAAPFTVTGLRTPVPRPEACTAPSSNCAF